MKIICGCCKKLIDTEKNDFCPKCGANFNYSETIKLDTVTKEREKLQEQIAEERRNAVESGMNNQTAQKKAASTPKRKNGKGACIGCLVAMIVVFSVGVGVVSEIFEEIEASGIFDSEPDTEYRYEYEITDTTSADTYDEYETPESDDDYNEYENPETDNPYYEFDSIEPEHYLIIGETAKTDTYAVSCTEIKLYENNIFTPSEGNMLVSFTIELQNTSGKDMVFFPSVKCFADCIKCETATFSAIYVPGMLEAGDTYSGNIVFEVPKEAVFYDLIIDDTVSVYVSYMDIDGYDPYAE